MSEVLTRRERHRLLQYVQASDSDEEADAAIGNELDFILEPITSEEQRHALHRDIRVYLSQAQPQAIGLKREDVMGAVATVLLYVVAVLPSLLPLLILPNDTKLAIHISSVVSFLVIFATGCVWGFTPMRIRGRPVCCSRPFAWPWCWWQSCWEASPLHAGSKRCPRQRTSLRETFQDVGGRNPPTGVARYSG